MPTHAFTNWSFRVAPEGEPTIEITVEHSDSAGFLSAQTLRLNLIQACEFQRFLADAIVATMKRPAAEAST